MANIENTKKVRPTAQSCKCARRGKDPPPTPFFTVSDKADDPNGFTIRHRLPSLNEYIDACRANRYKGAKFKEDIENAIILAIMQARTAGMLRRPTRPIRLVFKWHEKTKRRDADNIASAKKFILDAMQRANVVPNDSRKYVLGFTDEIIDDTSDFVEVSLIEAYDDKNSKKTTAI